MNDMIQQKINEKMRTEEVRQWSYIVPRGFGTRLVPLRGRGVVSVFPGLSSNTLASTGEVMEDIIIVAFETTKCHWFATMDHLKPSDGFGFWPHQHSVAKHSWKAETQQRC